MDKMTDNEIQCFILTILQDEKIKFEYLSKNKIVKSYLEKLEKAINYTEKSKVRVWR